MKFEKMSDTILLVLKDGEHMVISDAQSALDLIATARYEYGEVNLILKQEDVIPAFFDLKTRIAGEVLQKFVNYNMAVAIVGDYSGYSSKSLKDFIYESNKGHAVFFVESVELAMRMLNRSAGIPETV